MSKPVHPPPPAAPATTAADDPFLRASYERVLPKIRALPGDRLRAINVDVLGAVEVVLGALADILALRARVARDCPTIDLANFDNLGDLARALVYTHGGSLAAAPSVEPLPALDEEGIRLRDSLLQSAQALVPAKLATADSLAKVNLAKGYESTAEALVTLVRLFRGVWSKLEGHTLVELATVDRAEEIATLILSALGKREHPDATTTDASDERQRAYTLFVNAYDQVRRAVQFLRFDEGDADKIAPSIYNRSASARHKSADDTTTTPATPAAGATPATAPHAADHSAKPTAAPAPAVPAILTDPHGTVPPLSSPFTK